MPFWQNFKDWNDPDMVMANAARTATVVDAATQQMRMQTRVFYDNYFNLIGDTESASVVLPDISTDYPRDNTTALNVYMRPANEYTKQLDILTKKYDAALKAEASTTTAPTEAPVAPVNVPEKTPLQMPSEEAIQRSLKRLEAMANMDLQLARRDETQVVIKNTPKVLGFRRVIHPEMSASGSCGMCLAASRRWYTREDLEPIHYFCKCEVLPVTDQNDPGVKMNEEDERKFLDGLYGDAGGNSIDELSNTRYQLDEHGELGLVLAPVPAASAAKDTANGVRPAVVKKGKIIVPEKIPQAVLDAHQIKVQTASLARLREKFANGDTSVAQAIEWQTQNIALLQSRIAN